MCILALKQPLPPEVTPGRRRRQNSNESSTVSTSREASSSHIPKLTQVFSTYLSFFTFVETEFSQLSVVMIHPISETIPPGPDVVQPEIDPDLVSSLPEHLNPEVVQPEVFPTLVIPQSFVAIESAISHS